MPDYGYFHQEMQESSVTLSLLWVEYCGQCRAEVQIPYQSTQCNKYYSDYAKEARATMHLNHKPGDTMQYNWVVILRQSLKRKPDWVNVHIFGVSLSKMQQQE